MRVYRQRKTRRFPPLLKGMIGFICIVGLAFGLAVVWQSTENSVAAEQPLGSPVDEQGTADDELVEEDLSDSDESEEPEDSQDTVQEDDSEEIPETANLLTFEGAVPKSTLVPASYFDDALFIGDSISTGIPLYHVADNAAVVAMTGIHPGNINHYACIDIGEEEPVTVLEAAKQYGERAKVYIMLGGNGTGLGIEGFVEGYETFVDSVKAQYPNAIIYLQSMTPVVEGYQNPMNPDLNNETIDRFNQEILALAKRKQVYYLDVASSFKDENGNLPHEASPVDGLHFTPEYYAKWFEYLRNHTVATEGTT